MKILTIEDLARGFREGYAPEGNVLDAYGTMAEQYTEYLTGYSMEEQIANNGGLPDDLRSTCHQIANHLLSHEILTHGDFFSQPFHIPPFTLMQLEPYSKSGLKERIEEFNKTYGKFGKKSNMATKIIKLRNPRVTVDGKEIDTAEWCIRTNNIMELFIQDGKFFVIFSTCYYHMYGQGSYMDLLAEITQEEYDEIFEALKTN